MPWTRDRQKKFRLALLLLIPVVLAFGAYQLREPIAASTRSWRSARNLSKARHALEKEQQWEDAFQHALVARQLNPESVAALRILVEAAYQSRSVRTLEYANALFLSPAATSADKLKVLTIMQMAKDHVGFVRLYNLLPKEIRQEQPFVLVRVKFLIDRNALDSAKEILESEIETRSDRQFLLMLASLLTQPSATEEEVRRGQEIIGQLANIENPDQIARTAFQLLGFIDPDRIDSKLFGNLGARVDLTESVATAEYIAAANLAIAAAEDPGARQQIIEQAIARQGNIAPAQLAAWLQRMGESADVLSFLTAERGVTSPKLYTQRFRALVQAGRLDEADQWLKSPPSGVDEINIWLARAQLSVKQKERASESNAWEQAFKIAQVTANRNEYLRIFEVASDSGRIDLATRALLKAPRHPNGILPPAADAVAPMIYLTKENRIEDLRFLTEALVTREPENSALLNNLIYLNFLLGENVDASLKSARQLIVKNPRSLSLRTTLAMGLLVSGEDAEALNVLPGNSPIWEGASDADRAIRAMASEKNGHAEKAAEQWALVNPENLTDAEHDFFYAPPPEEAEAEAEGNEINAENDQIE